MQRLKARRVPFFVTLVLIATGMTQSFLWFRVSEAGVFGQTWAISNDIWMTFFTAHSIALGGYGHMYAATGVYLTMPAMALLMAPLSILTQALGLTASGRLTLEHPTAWLVLGPFEMLIGCFSLFAFDAIAQRLGVDKRRRLAICIVQGLLLYQVTAVWGHPEDAIAVGFAAYSMISMLDGRNAKAAWLLGAGIAFQPLVVVVLPLLIGRAGLKKAVPLTARAIGPAVVMVAFPLIDDFHATWLAVVKQPTWIDQAHVTFWTRFAPTMFKGAVSCGPTRLVAIAGSVALGYLVLRAGGWRDPMTLVWYAAVCLALRYVMESAEEAYYIWPALALFVLASANQRKDRFQLTCALSVALTVESLVNFTATWVWWGVAVLGLTLLAVNSMPPDTLSEAAQLFLKEKVPVNLEAQSAQGPRLSELVS